MNKKLEIFLELALINLFILNLAIGSISNFSNTVFLLKAAASFLLIVTTGVVIWSQQLKVRSEEFYKGIKKISVILLLFISYLLVTLTYSSNAGYGFQKILNFLISDVPAIFVFYYLILTLTKLRIKLFLYSIAVITIITVTYIVINYPFDQSTIYQFKPERWSHVIYGRMISSFAIVLLVYVLALKDKMELFFFIIVTSVAIYGAYLSAFRAGFIGILVLGAWFFVWGIYLIISKKLLFNHQTTNYAPCLPAGRLRTIELTLVPFLLAALLIITVPKPGIVDSRFGNMLSVDDMQFKNDPAIHSRLDAWELSWEIIKENPVIGIGLGGFNGYNNIEWTKEMKYPHNIILEMTSEGGVVGLLVLGSLFLVIFKSFRPVSQFLGLTSYVLLLTFFLFTLFLAMFSKDISSQSILWIFIAFIGLRRWS